MNNQASSSRGGPVAHCVAYPSEVDFLLGGWIIVDEEIWLERGVFLEQYFETWICCDVNIDGFFVGVVGLVLRRRRSICVVIGVISFC